MDNRTSHVIAALRLPLCVMVLAIHTFNWRHDFPVEGWPAALDEQPYWFQVVTHLVMWGWCNLAVPLFLVFAGYLFFRDGRPQWWQGYAAKLKRRVWTLLVPFVLWNLLVLGVNLLNEGWRVGFGEQWQPLLANPWIIVPGIFKGVPCDGPLWFVHDLMVLCLLTPLIGALCSIEIRGGGQLGWLVPAALFVGSLVWLPTFFDSWFLCLPWRSAFYFTLGCCCALYRFDFLAFVERLGRSFPPAALIYILCQQLVIHLPGLPGTYWASVSGQVGELVGAAAVVALGARWVECPPLLWCRRWAGAAFFVYAAHAMVEAFLNRYILRFLHSVCPDDFLMPLLALDVVSLFLDFGICFGGYLLLHRYTPRLCSLLAGGRVV